MLFRTTIKIGKNISTFKFLLSFVAHRMMFELWLKVLQDCQNPET